ncbi:MAG: helix-turn-helix transcriptional regulator [Aquificae bacterium]|nr:helix-turn-helix transcriptional regulator [Aquificota bacterium]
MVGERIRRLREERGLSVEEFAKRIGIPAGRVEEIESGKLEPCDATLVYISKLFEVSFWWLKEGRKEVAEVA